MQNATDPPLHAPQIVADIVFGTEGNSLPHVQAGFSSPEPGFTWSMGGSSLMQAELPAGPPDAGHMLELQLNPFIVPGRHMVQRLTVLVNGVQIGTDALIRACTIAYPIPHAAVAASPDQANSVSIRLVHPDFARPLDYDVSVDGRELGFMLNTLRILRIPARPAADITALPPMRLPPQREAMNRVVHATLGFGLAELAEQFESLGQNCEFGLVQRHMGAEPLGLLRFAGIALADLLVGLRCRFSGLGEELAVRTSPAASGVPEYMIEEERYHIGIHTFEPVTATTPEELRAEHFRRLILLQRHFLGRLDAADHIFVYQRPGEIAVAEARALHLALQAFGPNALLFVDQAPGLPSGAVEQIGHGLYHGKLNLLAPPGDAGRVDLVGWVSLCANACRLWRKQGLLF